MLDKLNLDMKGHITIHKGDEVIFEEKNQILPEALNIILRALDTTKNRGINKLHVVTSVGEISKDIESAIVNEANSSITFTTTLLESDFNGLINSLYLRAVPPTGEVSNTIVIPNFSGKTGLSILKDAGTRLRVSWEIIINKI